MRNIISISSLLEDVLTTPPSPPNPSFSFIQLPDCKFQFNTVAQNGYHTWDFGDNSMSNEVNPVHTFSSSGMYHVVHKVIGDNCITESMEIDITISCSSDFVCQCPPNNGLYLGSPGETTYLSVDYPQVGSSVSGCVAIAGHLVIDKNLLMNGADVHMNPGAAIEVESGYNLFLKGADLHGCDEMWQGIIVNNGAKLASGNQTTIEDAVYAVLPRAGSIVDMTSTNFIRNLVGIYSFEPFILNLFYGNTFDCTSALSPPMEAHYSEAGMIVTNGNLLNVGVSGQAPNVFQNLNNGIIATRNSLIVQNTNFGKIFKQTSSDNYKRMGFGIWASGKGSLSPYSLLQTGNNNPNNPSFSNCTTGIFAEGITVNVSKNKMDQMFEGIVTKFCLKNIDINENVISCTRTGIEISQPEPFTPRNILDNDITLSGRGAAIVDNEYVIMIEKPVSGLIRGNEITIQTPGSSVSNGVSLTTAYRMNVIDNTVSSTSNVSNSTGIYVAGNLAGIVQCNAVSGATTLRNKGIWASGSPSVIWQCNEVQNLRTGIRFDLPSFCSERFRGNIMDTHQTGLLLTAGARIGLQNHRGNTWAGSFNSGAGAARHEGGILDIQQSSFFAQQTSTYWPPSIVTPQTNTQWFFPSNPKEGEVYFCEEELPSCDLPGFLADDEVDDADYGIASDWQTAADTRQWLSERYLYRKLDNYPGLAGTGTVYDTFYVAKAATTVGQFTEIEKSIGALFSIDSLKLVQLDDNYSQLNEKMDSIRHIDSLVLTLSGTDSLNALATRLALFQKTAALTQANAGILAAVKSKRKFAANVVAAANDNITATEIYEENEKAVNDILLSTVAKGIISFDASQANTLKSIAWQCPLEGGNAVFAARSLLAVTGDTTSYDDDAICDSLEERNDFKASVPPVEVLDFILFPNPAKDEVTLIVFSESQKEDLEGFVVFFDVTGKEVKRKSLPKKSGTILIAVNDLAAGIYYCKVNLNGISSQSKKVAIIK